MKKLTFLLFVAGLFVISFTNTNCKRPSGDITPISGGDTQKTSTKIDSSGEDIHVTVFQNGTVTTGTPMATGQVEVYLFNNFTDETTYQNNGSKKSKYIDSMSASSGTCTFSKVKPPSGVYIPSSYGAAYIGETYTYYIAATWVDMQGKTETGWYTITGSNQTPGYFTVSINNGLNNAGLTIPVGVSP